MVKPVIKWLARRLLRNNFARGYIESELLAMPRGATNPQLRFAPPGHYASPLPDLSTLDDPGAAPSPSPGDGVALNADGQLRLLGELAEAAKAFDWPDGETPGRRFWVANGYYEHGDAVTLFAFLRRFRPRQVIEVGSGFTSALMLDANDWHLDSSMKLTFVEPHPDRLNRLLTPRDRAVARVIAAPVQRVPTSDFEVLEAGDFLFIDSSHVSKFGSDVNYLFFSVLPRLRPGVIVHVHDIFYPFEYPVEWFKEGRAFNELYLLRAFLQYNSAFEILFFNRFLASQYPGDVARLLPLMGVNPGGAIWLRKLDTGPDVPSRQTGVR